MPEFDYQKLPQVSVDHDWVHMGMHENYVALCGILQVFRGGTGVNSRIQAPNWTENPEKVTCLNCLQILESL